MTEALCSPSYPRVLPAGEAAFTVEFGDAVDAELNRRVHALDAALQVQPIPGVLECVPTYRSLLVCYDLLAVDGDLVLAALQERLKSMSAQATSAFISGEAGSAASGRVIEIPVRYGGESGPDLPDVAAHCGMDAAEVIRLHTEPLYQVAMLGFAPGFAYLLNLPQSLAMPRLETPRLRVQPGSIGIAGNQTGIYALGTPGGWRIIGRTDLRLFDPARSDPFWVKTGDLVRFRAVLSKDHARGY
jgi:KipI family sensor histidine kinase inhibitor